VRATYWWVFLCAALGCSQRVASAPEKVELLDAALALPPIPDPADPNCPPDPRLPVPRPTLLTQVTRCVETRRGEDGEPSPYVARRTYDPAGRLVRFEDDFHGDGRYTQLIRMEYRDDGRLERWVHDGVTQGRRRDTFVTEYRYNDAGQEVEVESHGSAPGAYARLTTEYDDEGRVESRLLEYSDGTDKTRFRRSFEYDACGRVVSELHQDPVELARGGPYRLGHWYLGREMRTRPLRDAADDAQGAARDRWLRRYLYDGRGHPLLREVSPPRDGVARSRLRWTYGPLGEPLSLLTEENADGRVHVRERQTVDGYGYTIEGKWSP
jgi:hypothetical protein